MWEAIAPVCQSQSTAAAIVEAKTDDTMHAAKSSSAALTAVQTLLEKAHTGASYDEQALVDAVKLAVTRCAAADVVAITSSIKAKETKPADTVSALVQTSAWEWMDAKETQTEAEASPEAEEALQALATCASEFSVLQGQLAEGKEALGRGSHSCTSRLAVSTVCGTRWVVSVNFSDKNGSG
jgi:hypothetical protein